MNIYEKMGDTIIVYMPREVDDYAAVKMTAGIDGVFAEEVVRHGLISRRYRQLHDRGGSVGVINVNARMDRILLMSGIYRIATRLDSGVRDEAEDWTDKI